MRTQIQKQQRTQSGTQVRLGRGGNIAPGTNHQTHQITELQRMIGNQAIQRMLNRKVQNRSSDLASIKNSRFNFDFSRIPINKCLKGDHSDRFPFVRLANLQSGVGNLAVGRLLNSRTGMKMVQLTPSGQTHQGARNPHEQSPFTDAGELGAQTGTRFKFLYPLRRQSWTREFINWLVTFKGKYTYHDLKASDRRAIYSKLIYGFLQGNIPIRHWAYLIVATERENFGRRAEPYQNPFNAFVYPLFKRITSKMAILNRPGVRKWMKSAVEGAGFKWTEDPKALQRLWVRMRAIATPDRRRTGKLTAWRRDTHRGIATAAKLLLAYTSIQLYDTFVPRLNGVLKRWRWRAFVARRFLLRIPRKAPAFRLTRQARILLYHAWKDFWRAGRIANGRKKLLLASDIITAAARAKSTKGTTQRKLNAALRAIRGAKDIKSMSYYWNRWRMKVAKLPSAKQATLSYLASTGEADFSGKQASRDFLRGGFSAISKKNARRQARAFATRISEIRTKLAEIAKRFGKKPPVLRR